MAGYVLPSITVYLLDDHDIVRRGMRDLLDVKRDITVLGDSASAGQATRRIVELQPDVMVLDLHLQDGSGIRVCRRVRAQAPQVHALLLTSADDDEALLSAVLAGADGYATKLVRTESILASIRAIGAGRSVLDSSVVDSARQHIMARIKAGALSRSDESLLSEVLAGRTDGEIAQRLQLPLEEASSRIADLIDEVMAIESS